MEEAVQDEDVPEEIEEQCVNCHRSLAAIERILKPLLSSNTADMNDNDKIDKIQKASLVVLLTYTINSLFWVSGSNSMVSAQAAKRFIRNALYDSEGSKKRGHESDEVPPEKRSKCQQDE